jgi:hypothetical protein
MNSTKPSDGLAAGAASSQSRREALKAFGRYAAVAPTTMLLLSPRSAGAHHKPWHNGGKERRWGKGSNSPY